MKTPPMAGPLLRIGVALLLCAACFQAGRSYQELTAAAAAERAQPDPGAATVNLSFVGPTVPAPGETSPAAAPGDVPGGGGDIITPLNVRDPSALVMGLSNFQRKCPPEPIVPEGVPVDPERSSAEPPVKEPKPRKMKEGRLLELLKKEDKKSVYPKRY